MKRFTIEFDGNKYNAVELSGKCVSDDTFNIDTIILAESALDEHTTKYMDDCDEWNNMYGIATEIYDSIFGFGSNDLICNGTEEELEEYAHSLL